MSQARVLYVGPMAPGRNEDLRSGAFEKLGCHLIRFGYDYYFDVGPRWARIPRDRLTWGA